MMQTGLVPLDEFVSAVLGFADYGFATEPMMRLLTEVRIRDADVARYVNVDPSGEYTRTLIHRTPEVEVLALHWPTASSTPIHDHAGQRCWMVAHSGVFVVEDYRQIGGTRAPGHAVVERVATTPGVTVGMPDFRFERERDIHRVSVSPQCDGAISIHVYVRPYTSCLIFDEAAREAREMRVDTFNAPF
ncbi:MAG: cysteine dioxygenase [Candidatus Tyrphobacter sp.]